MRGLAELSRSLAASRRLTIQFSPVLKVEPQSLMKASKASGPPNSLDMMSKKEGSNSDMPAQPLFGITSWICPP